MHNSAANSPNMSSLQLSSPVLQVGHTPAHAFGCFKLLPDRAMTLALKAPGVLRVAHGLAWVTFTGAANDSTAWAGDHFLNSDQPMHIKAGQAVVVEALSAAVYFDLALDAHRLVVIDSALTPRPFANRVLQAMTMGVRVLLCWLPRPGQSAHAAGQTRPHPFAAAARGCQS